MIRMQSGNVDVDVTRKKLPAKTSKFQAKWKIDRIGKSA